MRLFTALDIPEEVRAALRALIERLRPLAKLRWSSAENLHITTKFIGEWPEERLGEIQSALGQVAAAPVDITVRGLGWLPNQNRPRVFLANVEAGPELAALASSTERALAGIGVPVEERAFHPHLTLARIKDRVPLDALRRAAEAVGAVGSFRCTAHYLYLSAGGKYTKLGSFALL